MNVQIRSGALTDADAIAGFQIAMALETENKTLDPDVVAPAVRKVFSDPSKGFYLVATVDASDVATVQHMESDSAPSKPIVIGSLLITFEWSDWRDSYIWYIQSVYVDQRCRGQGVFGQLYARVMELAKEQHVMFIRLYVETENHRAQKVYESLGMKQLPYFMYDVKVEA